MSATDLDPRRIGDVPDRGGDTAATPSIGIPSSATAAIGGAPDDRPADADVVVLAYDGRLDAEGARELAPDLRRACAHDGRTILDLGLALLADDEAAWSLLHQLAADDDAVADLAIACDRMTGRLLLRRWGVDQVVPVFATVRDARQAALLADHGYGDGWATPGTLQGPTVDDGT